MTHTFALLPVPKVAWETIADIMEGAGYGLHYVVTDPTSRHPTVALDMQGLALIPAGDSDAVINSDRLYKLVKVLTEHAFRAGFAAGLKADRTCDSALDKYEPDDDLNSLWDEL